MNEQGARAVGWRMFSGVSVTGKPLDDVVCPRCAGTAQDDQEPSWRVRCTTCEWQSDDDEDVTEEGPLTAQVAKELAADHRCWPQMEIAPPDTDDWYPPSEVTNGGGLLRPKTVEVNLGARELPVGAR
jgi:hypothetical protein